MGHILLSAIGTRGDVDPFIAIGHALQRRGHEVTLATHCYYEVECRQAGFDFAALDTPQEFEAFTRDGDLLNSTTGAVTFLRRHIIPKIFAHHEIIHQHCQPNTVIVSRSSPGIAERLSAEKSNLPFICMLMAPHHVTTASLIGELLTSIFGAELNAIRTNLGLPRVTDWLTWWRASNLQIGLWPQWFSQASQPTPDELVLAGFYWRPTLGESLPPAEFMQMLAEGEAPILISGGTGKFGGKEFYTVSAEACARLGRRAILANRLPELLPDRLPSNVHWFKFIPSLGNYMPKMAAVIHHGGLITLSQALSAGIPQVILALGGDRPENAAYAEHLGVAKYLPLHQWRAPLVAQALADLMNSATAQERCRDVRQRLENADAVATTCEAIEGVLCNGKQHQNIIAQAVDQKTATHFPEQENTRPASKSARLAALTPQQQALLAERLVQMRQQKQK